MNKYWETELTDIYDGIIFRFKKLNPIDHINLVTQHTAESNDYNKLNVFITKCLSFIEWTKDGNVWTPLVDFEGNPRLPELADNPTIGFDVYYEFVKQVITPVFTESKTFRNLISAVEAEK